MRRYKLAIHILVIFSIFNFVPVLAAPIAAQEVREACAADVADEGEDVIVVSKKRAEEDQDPWSGYHGLRQASPDSGSMSVQLSSSSQHPRMLPSTSNDASGVHQETTIPIQLPSSASGGTELTNTNPIQLMSSASGGTELPGHNTEPHFNLLTPDHEKSMSTNEIGPATPYESESESESAPSESSGEIRSKSLSKVHQWNQDVENFKSQRKVPPPRNDWQHEFQAQSKPQPKSVWGKLTSKSKKAFKKLASVTKGMFREMVDNPKLQIRISVTANDAVNAAERELQGTDQH
jgi:hypothetical protein